MSTCSKRLECPAAIALRFGEDKMKCRAKPRVYVNGGGGELSRVGSWGTPGHAPTFTGGLVIKMKWEGAVRLCA